MLRNQWVCVLEASAVRRKPVGVRRFDRDLVLWRDGTGVVRVAMDACPHRGAALSRGWVTQGELVCRYHGLAFDGAGECVRVPARPQVDDRCRFRLHRFSVIERFGLVWVWNGDARDELPPLPWDQAFQDELVGEGGSFHDLTDVFDVSYLRVMENLTDYHHVAWVHRWTAPLPAEVTAFHAARDGLHIRTRATLGGRVKAYTHVVGPYLALLDFAGAARFAVIATPIDDEHVWLFARYTQRLLNVPGLNGLMGWVLGMLDYRLLQRHQDLPVWRTQRLSDPADISRYTLLDVDDGVRLYFAMHDELARC